MKTAMIPVGYLGPEETFAHLVARKRYGAGYKLIPLPSISEIFCAVAERRVDLGVVPIENSSGGTIYETVDCFIEKQFPVFIQEELSIKVNLALVGKRGVPTRVLYSHFAPLRHCEKWLARELPKVKRRPVASTALAASLAASEPGAAALTTRAAAKQYNLDILKYPVAQAVQNVTQFFSIGRRDTSRQRQVKMTLIARLFNKPGSLLDFLYPFKQNGINLSRILSRPVAGEPNAYVFFIDVTGTRDNSSLKAAIKGAKSVCESLRCAGVYPINRQYKS